MRHLPLHSDDELNHQQRCNHPICASVVHDPDRTPLAAMREEARIRKKLSAVQNRRAVPHERTYR
jgi:hypothetical protein